MISLREYQSDAVANLRRSIQQYRRSILVSPTGSGKTRIALRIVQGAITQGNSCWFVVHRRELCMQTSREFWTHKLEHGLIMSGKGRSRTLAQVGTVITAANYVETMPVDMRPKIIIFDEAHRSVSSSYQRLLDACPNAIVIGLTATPERTDGRGLGEIYSDMVQVQTMRWLIDHGYLCDYRLIAPAQEVDLSSVKTSMGDYATDDLERVMDRPTITGDAIAAYRKYADGKRNMVFCVSIKHSEHTCEQYNAAGIRAEHIDGTHTDAEREAALDRFRRGETLVLCSVQLAIEGLDIPAVEAIQQLRPTKSVIVYLQLIGRGLRPETGKQALIILDQVNNWRRMGLPDDERKWSLEGRKKGKRKAQEQEPDIHIQQCRACFSVFRKGLANCPGCGAVIEGGRLAPRQIEGELEEVDLEQVKRQLKREQGSARTLRDLVHLGIRRGMKRPAEWACVVAASRQGRRPAQAEYAEARRLYQEAAR